MATVQAYELDERGLPIWPLDSCDIDQWGHNGGILLYLWSSSDPAVAKRTVYCWDASRNKALQQALDSVTITRHKHVHPHVWPVNHPGREMKRP